MGQGSAKAWPSGVLTAQHCNCVLVGLLLRQCGSVQVKELVKGIDVDAQQGCCSLKLLMEHPAGLPVHSAPQIVGGLKGVLHGRVECLSTAQTQKVTRDCCLLLCTQRHARSCIQMGSFCVQHRR